MAAMHYNAQMVSEELQHTRNLYSIQHRLQDPGSSPKSEDAKSPEEVHFTRSPGLEDKQRIVRYPENQETGLPITKMFAETRNIFQEETMKFMEDISATRFRDPSPGSSPPNQQHNTGKTSFCIDALLGRVTSKNDHQKSRNHRAGVGTLDDEKETNLQNPETERRIFGNPLHPFQQHIVRSEDDDMRNRRRDPDRRQLTIMRNDPTSRSQFRSIPDAGDNSGRYRNSRVDDDEASVDVDAEVDPSRTGSASPGSNASRSPASSPPISPGSEDPTGNGILSHQNLAGNPYGVGAGVVRQNQGLLLHPGGPLIHPGGLYYHPAGGSAFHSIHKEGQPVGHPQAGGPHPQHHLHPLQLEWLARTGMLYPRLPADLAGKCLILFIIILLDYNGVII